MTPRKLNINQLIYTLKKVDPPQYKGQVLQTPVHRPIESIDCTKGQEVTNTVEDLITLEAQEYRDGELRWLSWDVVMT